MQQLLLNVSLIIVAVFNLFLGIFVFSKNRKNNINKVFLALTVCLAVWALTILMTYLRIGAKHLDFWSNATFWGPSFLIAFLLYFSLIFPENKKKISRKATILIFTPSFILFFLSVFQKINIKTYNAWTMDRGFGIYIFNFFLFFYLLLTFFEFYNTFKHTTGTEKQQVKFVFSGLLFAAVMGVIFNLIMPLAFGNARLNILGPSAAGTIFIIFITYAITKHHLFDIKIIATELLVGFLALTLTIDVFSSTTPFKIAFKTLILLITVYLGVSLIKSSLAEIKRRKQLEEMTATLKKANIELKRLDKAKSEFISIASHQLRTPLAAIKGYISMIIDGDYGKIPNKSKKPIKRIFEANERLIRLVNSLLSVSRIQSGKLEMIKEPLSLEKVISEAVDEIKIEAVKKNIYLRFRKPKKPLPIIIGDRDKLEQVILNIVDNAIKYTAKGGVEITVSEKMENDKKFLLIKVSDTGQGIAKGEKEKLFTSFSRGKAGIRFWTAGAGLGLYVAKTFVDMHHGKIWAQPRKKRGSTFFIELPVEPVKNEKAIGDRTEKTGATGNS